MTSEIKAIVFDFGGVLIGWDPRNLYSRFFPGRPQAMEDFLKEIKFMEWNAQQDKGRPFAEAVAAHSRQFPHHAHLINAYHENWKESLTGTIDGTVELLRALKKKGYPLYGLSNWSAETFPIVRDEYEFINLLDDIVISGEVKLIKPEPEIFELCLQKIGKPASQCLLIDDSEANINAAQKIGFDTVHFESPEQLKRELQIRQIL
ncbi:2-haloacid dehalogenase [Anaerolineales bacterium]|nr:2-haloacid dehalogenase [Anaerolineales bacterium]